MLGWQGLVPVGKVTQASNDIMLRVGKLDAYGQNCRCPWCWGLGLEVHWGRGQ